MKNRIVAVWLIPAMLLAGCRPDIAVSPVDTPAVVVVPTGTETAVPTSTTEPTGTPTPVLVITIDTAEDIADGDASSFDALTADRGPDRRISLREAVRAADGTSGRKRIIFDAGLSGQTIAFEAAEQHEEPRMILTGEGITVDGDVDGDGEPDITLDGSRADRNHSSAFILSGRNLVIQNLVFREFRIFAIMIACVDSTCSSKPFQHIRISDNQIYSEAGGGGVVISPTNVAGSMDNMDDFSGLEVSDVEISGNVIDILGGNNPGVFMMAAGGGGSKNRLADILIRGNRIRSPGATITVNGADGNSAYFHLPGPERFSDDNVAEHIVIADNILDPQGVGGDGVRPTGIIMLAGNFGNSRNVIRGVEITGNEISSHAELGIGIYATMNTIIPGLPMPGRAAADNTVEDVRIEGNTVRAEMSSLKMYAVAAEDPLPAGESGRLADIRILTNSFLDYKFEAVSLFGGVGASDGRLENVRVEENIFRAKDPAKGMAFFAFAGGCSGCTRVSERNEIRGLLIQGNTVEGNVFIAFSAGMEEYASDNYMEFYLGPNDVTPADAEVAYQDAFSKNPQGNRIVRLDSAPAGE